MERDDKRCASNGGMAMSLNLLLYQIRATCGVKDDGGRRQAIHKPSNGGTAMSLYEIQATDGVNGGRVTVKRQTTSDTQP